MSYFIIFKLTEHSMLYFIIPSFVYLIESIKSFHNNNLDAKLIFVCLFTALIETVDICDQFESILVHKLTKRVSLGIDTV